MSAEGKISPRRHRRLSEIVGAEVYMAFATWDSWIMVITPDDRHIGWHRRTGEIREDQNPTHWNTCPVHGSGTS